MTDIDLPLADSAPYWKTGKSSADSWIDKAHREVTRSGGHVTESGFGEQPQNGRAAYLLAFHLGADSFRLVWPVLPTKNGTPSELNAAKRQAATMLYHDIKARGVSSLVLGARRAFFAYLRLPDGRSVSDLTEGQIPRLPVMMQNHQKLLTEGAKQ